MMTATDSVTERPKIAVFAGATATILNTEPLVTSNKSRAKYGLPLLRDRYGMPLAQDVLRPQRLARPAVVLVEQFSAHPLEREAAHRYAPPDGYVDSYGVFTVDRRSPSDTPVFEVELRPEDGLYLLPYVARQANGEPWDHDMPTAAEDELDGRQPFFPDASRLFEEVDRFGLDEHGWSSTLSARATFDFYRASPPGGYRRGLAAANRTDAGKGDISPEVRGRDFFPYRPYHLAVGPRAPQLARLTNLVASVLGRQAHAGAIWLEGSPHLEETLYWLALLIDAEIPIVGNAAQRPHGALGSDGERNLLDGVEYITSRAWADAAGRDLFGPVIIQDQVIFTAREAYKADARPGGYRAGGGAGGVIGLMPEGGPPQLRFRPVRHFTHHSAVRLTELPPLVSGVSRRRALSGAVVEFATRNEGDGGLRPEAVPDVFLFKEARYPPYPAVAAASAQILPRLEGSNPLTGIVAEGSTPYGTLSEDADNALLAATFAGCPVVKVGRGNPAGPVPRNPSGVFISGDNLSATKARLLLMACLLRFGALPPAKDPRRPSRAERERTRACLNDYQAVFDTH